MANNSSDPLWELRTFIFDIGMEFNANGGKYDLNELTALLCYGVNKYALKENRQFIDLNKVKNILDKFNFERDVFMKLKIKDEFTSTGNKSIDNILRANGITG